MRPVLFGFMVAGLACAGIARADFSTPAWEYRARISGAAVSGDYLLLDLPVELFSYLKPDLSDLRVTGDGGREVPYVAAVEREQQSVAVIPARVLDLSSVPGENTRFVADLGRAGILHNSVTMETPSENFRRHVAVEGSNDRSSWRTLTASGQIFDYTVRDIKSVAVRDTRVSYPDATFRYLRVTIADRGEPALSIRGASVREEVAVAAREIAYHPSLALRERAEDRATEVVLDLGAKGIPHRRGRIETASANFSRAVEIADSEDGETWRLLTRAYLFNINTSKFNGANLDFTYPESNRRYLKLTILNRDDQPIAVSGASLFGVVRRILFRFEPGREYWVYAGNAAAIRPQYDIEAISQYVDVAELDRATLGPIEKNPLFVPPLPKAKPFTERAPYALPVMLGVVVAVLAFLLIRVISRGGGVSNQPPIITGA